MTLIITPVIPWCFIRGAGYDDYPCDLAIFSNAFVYSEKWIMPTIPFYFLSGFTLMTLATCYTLKYLLYIAAYRYLFRCTQYFSREILLKKLQFCVGTLCLGIRICFNFSGTWVAVKWCFCRSLCQSGALVWRNQISTGSCHVCGSSRAVCHGRCLNQFILSRIWCTDSLYLWKTRGMSSSYNMMLEKSSEWWF